MTATNTSEPEGLTGTIEEAPVRGVVAVRTREEERISALAHTPVTDIATMSDDAFEKALQRAKLAKQRVSRVMDEILVDGAHYGNPQGANGRPVFKKPIFYQAGAELCETTFRLTVYSVGDDQIVVQPPTLDDAGNTADPGYVSITVQRALYTFDGTRLGVTTANCNSREKRFRKYSRDNNGNPWTYEDARETLNDCLAMAEKRAKVRLVRAALGLTPWLANEEEMEKDEDKAVTPWSPEEKQTVFAAATARSMGRKALAALVFATVGKEVPATGAEVKSVLAAIATWQPPAKNADAEKKPAGESLELEPEMTDEEIQAQDRARGR